jgi:hypothetical protein
MRHNKGASLRIEKARPGRSHDFLEVALSAVPPAYAPKTLIRLLIDGHLVGTATEPVPA